MSDVDHGEPSWLAPPQERLAASGEEHLHRPGHDGWRVTLHPLSGSDGLSMVVVPCDDIRRPRKVRVVERGAAPGPAAGVLIYSLDPGIDGGDFPVVVHPREGHGLDDAPHRVGNVADIEKGAHLRVTVLGRTGPAWDVEISFTPAPRN